MSIQFPIRAERTPGARFAHIVDSVGRVLFGVGTLEDAEQLVAAANAGANLTQPIGRPARRKNKRDQIVDKLRKSDPIAQLMERDDEIIYGPHDELPQAGEFVARLGSKAR